MTTTAFSDPRAVQPTLFLGDSITYSGLYIAYFEAYLRVLRPNEPHELLNCGLPSETLSGLTEPNHAGGAFPRPDLHERLDRVLKLVKPAKIYACYGMNDGIYHPFSEERFQAYQRGMVKLRERAGAVPVVHITPPVFDPNPIRKTTLPAGRNEYPSGQPYEGYDTVLDHYSRWLMSQRRKGWKVIDCHTPMHQFLEQQRKTNPDYALAGDGVHLNEVGHWIIAKALISEAKVRIPKGGHRLLPIPLDQNPTPKEGEQSKALFGKIVERQRVLCDSYLTTAGHLRPGMAKGLSVERALQEAERLEREIQALLESVKE
jgi:lysophospholipase L1-like esterase